MTKHRLFSQIAETSAITLGLCAGLAGTALACGDNAYLGQVCIVATTYCPENTMEANGQILKVTENPALFSQLGCAFGGDCRETFNLPDIRSRTAVHEGQGIGLTERVFATSFGEETVTQTLDQMAAHYHGASFVPTPGEDVQFEASQVPATNSLPSTGDYLGITLSGALYTNADAPRVELSGMSGGGITSGVVTIMNTGLGEAMPNVPPEIAMRYCIVTDGIYPPHPQ